MPRSRHHLPLSVYMGTHLIGHLLKEASGAISFRYAPLWLSHPNSRPVSLSLPLREGPGMGELVAEIPNPVLSHLVAWLPGHHHPSTIIHHPPTDAQPPLPRLVRRP